MYYIQYTYAHIHINPQAHNKCGCKQITNYKSNAKKQWKVLNEIINRRKTKCKISKLKIGENEITNSADICNHFNSYFCNIASKLKSEIQHSSADKEDTDAMKYLQVCQCEQSCACTKSSIFLEPCSITEITTIIKELNNSSASDFNTIILKSVNHDIASALTNAVNASLEQGVFPTILKMA